MQVGFLGLGKMGKHMVFRLLKDGHKVVAYNRSPEPREEVTKKGALAVASVTELVGKLKAPRVLWLMMPSAIVDDILAEVVPLLSKGDLIVDGGNSNFRLSMERGKRLAAKGIRFMDAGVSGGLVASKLGYCIMAGGEGLDFAKAEPLFKSLCVKDGYLHTGPVGSGHYVKMTHNAIEYGIMQAMGEGFELLEQGPYKNLDMEKIAHLWNHGSIVRGFLMEMAESAFAKDARLDKISGYIEDTGEGMWAIQEAMSSKVPFSVNTFALFERYRSRKDNPLGNRLVAALRNEFGGHEVKKK